MKEKTLFELVNEVIDQDSFIEFLSFLAKDRVEYINNSNTKSGKMMISKPF